MACRAPILPAGARPAAAPPRPALLLDRDGVINVDHGYVGRREDVQFLDGIGPLCAAAAARGWALVVITNQAGIGRGYYTEADFARLTGWMAEELRARGAAPDAVFYCPHHPRGGQGEYLLDCPSRKPGPAMIQAAAELLGLDLARSALLGDKASDVAAGRAAGVGRLLLLGDAGGRPVPDGTVRVASLDEARRLLFGAPG